MFLCPLAIAAVGMVASIIGAFMVKSYGSTSVHDLGKALHRSTNTAAFITIAGVLALAYFMLEDSEIVEEWWGLTVAVLGGLSSEELSVGNGCVSPCRYRLSLNH